MEQKRKRLFSRRRLFKGALVIVLLSIITWFAGRFAIARWIVARTLADAGLENTTFVVSAVSLRSIELAEVRIGATPWLTADKIIFKFTISDLLVQRVSTIDINRAMWTVRDTNGVIDWGYAPAANDDAQSKPLSLSLPFDHINLNDSAVEWISRDVARKFPVALSITTSEAESLDGTIDVTVLGWNGAITFNARNTLDAISLDAVGHVRVHDQTNNSRLAITAQAERSHADGVLQINTTIDAESFLAQWNENKITVGNATFVTHAQVTGDGAIDSINAQLNVKNAVVNSQLIRQLKLTAATPDDPQVYSLKDLPLLLDLATAGDGWNIPAAAGKLRVNKLDDATVFTIGMTTTQPVSIHRDTASIEGTLNSLAAGMTMTLDNNGTHLTDGKLSLGRGTLRVGDLNISDARLQAKMPSENEIQVTLLDAVVGEGSTVSAAPFTFDPSEPVIGTRLTIGNLTLEHWLPIMTSEHATGEGRVSGYVDLAVDFTSNTPRINQLSGFLNADPEHGFIQVTDADTMGELLDKQDPRFATDELMKPVRDKIVSALRDFSFNKLSVDFSREGDVTSALAYLSGQGRHGQDPQGVNLTLDLTAEDAFLNAYLRLAERFSMKRQAQDALDRFFNEAATPAIPKEAEQ